MATAVAPCVTAGLAVAGVGFWLAATTDTPPPTDTGVVQLTSVESPACGGDPLCALTGGSTPPKLNAALATPALTPSASPITSLIGVFISNGTAAHPNAGLLIGNGFDATNPGEKGGNGGL